MDDVMTAQIANDGATDELKPCTHNYQVNCGNCRLNSICLPLALESDDIEQLDNIIQRSKPLQKNQHLYREGDEFQSVYAVRSGTLKAYKTTDDGREQLRALKAQMAKQKSTVYQSSARKGCWACTSAG